MAKPRKQLSIAGTESKEIKEVADAAETYVGARDKRMEFTVEEVATRDALIGVMTKHKLTVYKDTSTDPPLVVTLVPGKDKVRVRREKDGEVEVS